MQPIISTSVVPSMGLDPVRGSGSGWGCPPRSVQIPWGERGDPSVLYDHFASWASLKHGPVHPNDRSDVHAAYVDKNVDMWIQYAYPSLGTAALELFLISYSFFFQYSYW